MADTPPMLTASDHDLLIRIDTRQETMEKALVGLTTDTRDRIKELELEKQSKAEASVEKKASDDIHYDHERRIRVLERNLWLAIGGMIVLEFGIQVATKFYGL